MEAARVAALRGHQVALYEREATLGGTMRVAAQCPWRGELADALRWWEGELVALGVEVHTGAHVAESPAADAVVWAVGAVAGQAAVLRRRPSLVEGIEGARDLPHGRQVLTGQASVRGRVLVIDEEGGWPAVSLAESLAADPCVSAVTVVTASSHFGAPELEFTTELPSVSRRLAGAGVDVHCDSLVARVVGGRVQLEGGDELGPFDAIVLSTGAQPRPTPEGASLVGDCLAPRGVWAATTDAARLARTL
jgi:2,4-dienoyl-CoA reductase (NADPH2)